MLMFARGALTKICSKCGEEKSRTEFNKEKGKERAYCKACHTAYSSGWAAANREKRRLYMAEYYRRNPEKYKAMKAKPESEWPEWRRQKKIAYSRKRHLERKYGITPEIWQEMFDRQNGVCALCQIPGRTGRHGKLAVDHCHTTGRVRGLLCASCNVAVGILGDSPERLERVLAYLRGQDAQASDEASGSRTAPISSQSGNARRLRNVR